MNIQKQFSEIIFLIKEARHKAFRAINQELIDLYWEIGKYITERTQIEGWGKSTVGQLAEFIQSQGPDLKGFSDKNLWRMKQFYETYKDNEKLSSLLRELSWTHNLAIIAKCKREEEREFYLKLAIGEKLSVRDLERQIKACTFERIVTSSKTSFSPVLTDKTDNIFKELYVLEFLNLPAIHGESDLQKELIKQMKKFILELGKDFLFMGEEYRLQVGNKDFYCDLLFYHRALQCLVVFELKTTEFEPEHLGQLNFYLEALDRDVKKENEKPSIGVLLCKNKDKEIVEYALSRNLSPALISEYTLSLPDKKLLQNKLHEFYELLDFGDSVSKIEAKEIKELDE
jgi:predicted nuclease of restriction endonuclease-like (RecB) superfamily